MREVQKEDPAFVRALWGHREEFAITPLPPAGPVLIGMNAKDAVYFGEASVLRNGELYRLLFRSGMPSLDVEVFARHERAVDNAKPIHRVTARLTVGGREISLDAIMTMIAHDEIHLCAWGEDAQTLGV